MSEMLYEGLEQLGLTFFVKDPVSEKRDESDTACRLCMAFNCRNYCI